MVFWLDLIILHTIHIHTVLRSVPTVPYLSLAWVLGWDYTFYPLRISSITSLPHTLNFNLRGFPSQDSHQTKSSTNLKSNFDLICWPIISPTLVSSSTFNSRIQLDFDHILDFILEGQVGITISSLTLDLKHQALLSTLSCTLVL